MLFHGCLKKIINNSAFFFKVSSWTHKKKIPSKLKCIWIFKKFHIKIFGFLNISVFLSKKSLYCQKCIFHGYVKKIINHFAEKGFGLFIRAHSNKIKIKRKFGKIIYYFFQTSMKKHLNKNALMLSRKGNLFCNALKNQR